MWLVLAGRCPLPSWLTRPYVNGRLSVIPEEDLRLSEKEIAQLYLSWGVQLPRNLLEKRIIPLVEGNPLGARLLAMEMSQGSSYTEELMNDLTRKFYEYLNQAIYSEWPEEIREMMMQLSLLEHFTIQQAEEMTGRSDVNRLLAQAAETGNLFSIKDGGYTLRPAVINSMKLRMETVCDRVRKNELLRRAGTICEKEGNIPRALKLYQDGQCEKEIHALLIDNARRYPGGGYYYELTPAYLALPEEEVRSSPDLIAARSMLYSLALNATESERWYAVLQEYAAGHPDPEEHRLAESWLVYLDISLPHRGSTNLIEVLDEAARKIQTERLVMPEFSVTGGQPSVINGSKDFCDWTRDDQTMAFQLEKHAGEVLGPYSKGLVSIGLAESLFEKGGNIYKVLELANRGLMETMNGGKFELQFVGAALVARVYLVTGHPGDSVKTLEEIETRAQQHGVHRVVRNVRAMQSRIKLWQGRVEDAVRWMENEPQNEIHFNVLERYCYNTFVRVYMAQQRYDKAAQILMRLRSYANMEKRPWLQMEGDLLESGADVHADVLKAGHHGSPTSSSEAFLTAVQPSVAVISVGADNDYGHPGADVLARLEALNAEIYRTDTQGEIIIVSDGETLSITTDPTSREPAAGKDAPFVGNRNSMIVHSASCAKLPGEDNRVYFNTAEEAEEYGYQKHTCIK